MAALLPVGPRPADITERPAVCRGHAGVATAGSTRGHVKFSSGVFLSPLGFTHPLSIKRLSLPLAFLSLCACVF